TQCGKYVVPGIMPGPCIKKGGLVGAALFLFQCRIRHEPAYQGSELLKEHTEYTGMPLLRMASAPPRSGSSIMAAASCTLAPRRCNSLEAAIMVPPVATRSSMSSPP